MLPKDKIDRINDLARKSKDDALTEEERIEQANLRKEYLASLRSSLEDTLAHVHIKDEDGNISPIKKKTQH